MNTNTNNVNGSAHLNIDVDRLEADQKYSERATRSMAEQLLGDETRKLEAEAELLEAEAGRLRNQAQADDAEAAKLSAQARLKDAETRAEMFPAGMAFLQNFLENALSTYKEVELARIAADVKMAETAPEVVIKRAELEAQATKQGGEMLLALLASLPLLTQGTVTTKKTAVKKTAVKKPAAKKKGR